VSPRECVCAGNPAPFIQPVRDCAKGKVFIVGNNRKGAIENPGFENADKKILRLFI
jgi:hypothetical protein